MSFAGRASNETNSFATQVEATAAAAAAAAAAIGDWRLRSVNGVAWLNRAGVSRLLQARRPGRNADKADESDSSKLFAGMTALTSLGVSHRKDEQTPWWKYV